MAGLIKIKTFSQNLATAGLTASFSPESVDFEIVGIMFKTAGSASETFTITFDNPAGSTYDCVVGSASLSTATDVVWAPATIFRFPASGALTIASTNATSTMLYVTVLYKEL